MTEPFTHAEEYRLFAWFKGTTARPWDSLSDAESAVWRVYLFELQVANGGFHQAFLNDGDKWQETLQALRTIGADKIAQMFEEALTVFPKAYPSHGEARYQEMLNLDKNAEDLLWRLTCEYCELYRQLPDEDAYAKMYAFLKQQNQIE